ncbi:MAG: PIG-L deacetylase family protein [Gemmatimonadota bacterium]
MSERAALRLMCVTAHPDDESLGFGGTLTRYAADGMDVSLVVGTRGERGRFGDGSKPHPGPEELGRIREGEARAASEALGIGQVRFLGYRDAELDAADAAQAAGRVAACIRELQPDVVLTFDPFGVYGHPDHIAISQQTLAGVVLAATADTAGGVGRPHQVQKVYVRAWSDPERERYERAFKPLRMTVAGEVRASVAWPAWSVTTVVSSHDHWEKVWRAVQCHQTQMAQYESLLALTPEDHRSIWGTQEYYRVYSLVNGGRERERDLFEGLR